MQISWKQVVMFGLAAAAFAACAFFMAQCSQAISIKNAETRATCFARAADVTDCLQTTRSGAP